MIEIKAVRKKYKQHIVLDDICFTASSGDCVGILGENGCGKSTLLSILAGALSPDRGEFLYQGRDLFASKKLLSETVGYVPQEDPFIEGLSVLDNLSLWYPESPKALEQRLQEGSLAMFDLYGIRKQKVEKLSGGMKKRLSIACAISGDPKICILDEPTAALDLACKEAIRHWMFSYCQKGGILLFSSHEEEDFSLFTHPYYMEHGVLSLLPKEHLKETLRERMGIA